MTKSNILSAEEYKALPVKERVIRTTGAKLISHFRGLESAGIIGKDIASAMIGCIRKLQSVARGEEVEQLPHGTQTARS